MSIIDTDELPPGVVASQTGWLVHARDYTDREAWRPCWYLQNDLYMPPLAVVEHENGQFWVHGQNYEPHGDSIRVAGPYDDLLTALVVLRIMRANGKPNVIDIIDYFDSTPTPENEPDETH